MINSSARRALHILFNVRTSAPINQPLSNSPTDLSLSRRILFGMLGIRRPTQPPASEPPWADDTDHPPGALLDVESRRVMTRRNAPPSNNWADSGDAVLLHEIILSIRALDTRTRFLVRNNPATICLALLLEVAAATESIKGDSVMDQRMVTRLGRYLSRAITLIADLDELIGIRSSAAKILSVLLLHVSGDPRDSLRPNQVSQAIHEVQEAMAARYSAVHINLGKVDSLDLNHVFQLATREMAKGADIAQSAELAAELERARNSFKGADLSSITVADVGVLGLNGLVWSSKTQWPAELVGAIERESVEIGPGVFQIRPGTRPVAYEAFIR